MYEATAQLTFQQSNRWAGYKFWPNNSTKSTSTVWYHTRVSSALTCPGMRPPPGDDASGVAHRVQLETIAVATLRVQVLRFHSARPTTRAHTLGFHPQHDDVSFALASSPALCALAHHGATQKTTPEREFDSDERELIIFYTILIRNTKLRNMK